MKILLFLLPRSMTRVLLLSFLSLILGAASAAAAEYQWSVTVDGATEPGLDPGYPRAFLWIPPDCNQVRAVILSQNNMQEASILEDPSFRKTMGELGFAEIWITPSLGSIHFRFDRGAGELLEKVLGALATVSGYKEIAYAPLVPMGHSATASFCWDVAAWKPERTLAVLSISGQWPYYRDENMGNNSSPDWKDHNVDGVPGLTTKGEYEIGGKTDGWYFGLRGDSFQKHPRTAFTQVVEPGGGHFNATPEKIALIGLYLRKAAQYRLPADAPTDQAPTLKPIDPTKDGWLFDSWHLDQPPVAPAARVDSYNGPVASAYWAFDEEMAKAIEEFQGREKGKTTVLIGYRQKDGLTPPIPDHAMVHLKFEPQPDGTTFKLTGGFWDTVPPTADGKGAEWDSWIGEGKTVNQGDALPHPQDEDGRIVITPICGPVVQTAPDTFAIQPYRIGTKDVRRSNDIWLVATYPGNDTYKKMTQQAELRFPFDNHNGKPQTIDFPEVPDQVTGSAPVQLHATSDAGTPISYYVREGPAEVDAKGMLTLLPAPPRSAFPIKVTVVAWQWGSSIDPKIQTAQPVERTFSVNAH